MFSKSNAAIKSLSLGLLSIGLLIASTNLSEFEFNFGEVDSLGEYLETFQEIERVNPDFSEDEFNLRLLDSLDLNDLGSFLSIEPGGSPTSTPPFELEGFFGPGSTYDSRDNDSRNSFDDDNDGRRRIQFAEEEKLNTELSQLFDTVLDSLNFTIIVDVELSEVFTPITSPDSFDYFGTKTWVSFGLGILSIMAAALALSLALLSLGRKSRLSLIISGLGLLIGLAFSIFWLVTAWLPALVFLALALIPVMLSLKDKLEARSS